jgi:hypothetical protein
MIRVLSIAEIAKNDGLENTGFFDVASGNGQRGASLISGLGDR